MKVVFLKGKTGRFLLVLLSLFMVTGGGYIVYLAIRTGVPYSLPMGNFLLVMGLATFAIPFILTESNMAKDETSVRRLEKEMDDLKNKFQNTKP